MKAVASGCLRRIHHHRRFFAGRDRIARSRGAGPLLGGGSHIPDLWPIEIANVSNQDEATASFWHPKQTVWRTIRMIPVEFHAISIEQIETSIRPLAQQHGLSSYDASYLDLARRLGVPLATLDRKLRAAAEAENIPVLWIMKTSDTDILIVPGWSGSGPTIGKAAGRPSCRRLAASSRKTGTSRPRRLGRPHRRSSPRAATKPVVIVAHSARLQRGRTCRRAAEAA